MASLDYARKGDVIVIAAKGDETAAVIGDRWAYWAKRIGVAGVVVDGLARDLAGLVDVGLPIFARGICPNSGFKNGPGEINTRVSCGGIAIEPGDVIIGDQDGVIAIPRNRAADVAAQLKLVEQREATLDAELRRADQAKFWNDEAARARRHPLPGLTYISSMPPGPPGAASGIRATMTSVVRMRLAIEPAFCSAVRVTLHGSRMPIATRSPYSVVATL
jgi:regulator of RNase E activity RraA